MPCDTLGEVHCGRFGNASSRHHLSANVHQSVQEGACGDHYAFGIDVHSPDGVHSNGGFSFGKQFIHLVLPHVEQRCIVQCGAPLPDVFSSVALCSGAPHCRSFRAVEHSELYGGGVGHPSHFSSQCVNLSNYLSFGDASDGRVARHLCYFVHVHRHQTGLCAHVGGSHGSLASSVASSHHHHIVFHFKVHSQCVFCVHPFL